MDTIKFYNKSDKYYEFSNFYGKKDNKKFKLVIDDFEWNTTEQYFQAYKFYIPESEKHMSYFKLIQTADTPMKVFALARQKKLAGYQSKWNINNKTMKDYLVNTAIDDFKDLKIRSDWEDVKIDIMYKALLAKFTQNRDLTYLLKDTKDAEIIEDSPRDYYWGIGKDGKGQNMLGKLLMQVRTEI